MRRRVRFCSILKCGNAQNQRQGTTLKRYTYIYIYGTNIVQMLQDSQRYKSIILNHLYI